jgi:glutamine amidotransferase
VIRIAVVDHGAGNLVSIGRALENCGASVNVATTPHDLDHASGVVLPGVGATGAAMTFLAGAGMDEALRSWQRSMLGICVGMQMLFESSEEDDGACLGLLPGRVGRLRAPILPHMGWNDVHHEGDPIFTGIADGTTFYFAHSFAAQPAAPPAEIATTTYGDRFSSAVRNGDRVGVQFHPERSGQAGLRLLANFVAICRGRSRAT